VPEHGSDLWLRFPGMRKLDAAEMVQAVRRVEAPLALAVCGLEPRLRVVAIISLVIEVRAQNSPCFSGLIHHVFVVTLDVGHLLYRRRHHRSSLNRRLCQLL
jgi:hypothetical protein